MNPRVQALRKPQHWAAHAIGRSGCSLTSRIYVDENRIDVFVDLHHPDEATALFHALVADRENIEQALGKELLWNERPGVQRSEIIYSWEADPADQEDWPAEHEKLAATLDDF